MQLLKLLVNFKLMHDKYPLPNVATKLSITFGVCKGCPPSSGASAYKWLVELKPLPNERDVYCSLPDAYSELVGKPLFRPRWRK